MTPVRLEPAASQSQVKHSTSEPLHRLKKNDFFSTVLSLNRLSIGQAMIRLINLFKLSTFSVFFFLIYKLFEYALSYMT